MSLIARSWRYFTRRIASSSAAWHAWKSGPKGRDRTPDRH